MVDFVEICNVCARKAIIEAAKMIINYDKVCHSYSDLNFGVTFLEHSVVCFRAEYHGDLQARSHLSGALIQVKLKQNRDFSNQYLAIYMAQLLLDIEMFLLAPLRRLKETAAFCSRRTRFRVLHKSDMNVNWSGASRGRGLLFAFTFVSRLLRSFAGKQMLSSTYCLPHQAAVASGISWNCH